MRATSHDPGGQTEPRAKKNSNVMADGETVKRLPAFTTEVRVVERSTEGLHSIAKRCFQRAPAAAISYVSLELRHAHLLREAISAPQLFAAVSERHRDLFTLSGYRSLVLEILGLKPSDFFRSLSDRQLADLLYRDSIVLKHTTSGTIARAVASVEGKSKSATGSEAAASPLTSAIVDFLVEARCSAELLTINP